MGGVRPASPPPETPKPKPQEGSQHASPSPLPEVLTDFALKLKSLSCRQDKDGGSLTTLGLGGGSEESHLPKSRNCLIESGDGEKRE